MSTQHRILLSIKFLSLFFLFIIFINYTIIAQTTDGHFPVGAFMGSDPTEAVKLSYDESGLNTIVWKAYPSNQSYLNKYDVMAFNINSTDWINHYATGCYSKWESEENQTDTLKIGVKHIRKNGQFIGSEANWGGVQCWSTVGLNGPADSLIYGPHYFQAKKYRRVYGPNEGVIRFIPRFNMALDYNPQLVNPTDPVCKIKVVYRYNEINDNSKKYSDILLEKTLTVSDFPIPDSFKVFSFNSPYYYDTDIFPSDNFGRYSPDLSQIDYTDWVTGTGIQFCVDWLGDSDLGSLYVDFAEVYDDYGWNEYISNPEKVADTLEAYSHRYSNWNNIKYWYAHDEPHSIDAFAPIHVVDSLVRAVDSIPLITHFFEVNVYKNGEYIYEHFYNAVHPDKLMFDAYPFHTDTLTGHGYMSLPIKFQQSHNLQPGFYYVPQSFGRLNSQGHLWGWYKPDSAKLKAITMLALAHGSKGIMFSDYYKYWFDVDGGGWIDGIVDSLGNRSEMWYVIHDNLAPRLKGTLGKTLLGLDYTGDYLQLKYITPTQNPFPQPSTFEYLTIGLQQSNDDMNWHVGFLKDSANSDNKYFLMDNLLTDSQKSIQVKVTDPIPGFTNYRFRNIEPQNNLDITFTVQTIQTLNFPAGEGYLFHVAPVVKYGGLLAYNDTIKVNTTLSDNMTIDAGKVLQINEGKTYTITDTITFTDTSSFITGYGYINRTQNGWIITRSWNRSLFKGRSGSHPKLIWSKHPDITNVINYKIYRNHTSGGWQYLTTKSSSTFEYIDSTITIIEGMPQANETSTQYRITATYRPTRDLVETSPSNTILYHRVEGQGLEKQNYGITSDVFTYNLDQNYPNPFNPTTTISYSIAEDGIVILEILNILGERIKTLVNEFKSKGNHNISFNASSLASGVYIYKIQSGDFITSKKMILLK